MLEHRIKGCFWTFGALLMATNVLLFLAYIWIEHQVRVFGLYSGRTIYIYSIGIPLAYFFAVPWLSRVFEQLHIPSLWKSLTAALRMVMVQGAAFVFVYFMLKDVAVSRAFILSYLPASLLFNWGMIYHGPGIVSRLFFQHQNRTRAILYGQGPLPEDLRRYIRKAQAIGIQFIGYYADEQLHLPEIEWRGRTDEVLYCEGGRKKLRPDLVFAYTDFVHRPAFKEAIDKCVRSGARIQIYSNLSGVFLDPVRVESDGSMIFLTFFDEPLQNPLNLYLKRTIDIAISLPVCVLVLPPLALCVKLVQIVQSRGPLFFRQTRYGLSRKPFTILKFRTMHVHDRSLEAKQATRGDARIFRFGAFLRRTSLDEFPQFINVLRGEMSVVGPRPHLTLHDEQFERHYRRYRSRHFVKPGITGLAQTSGYRGEAPNEEAIIGRVQHDLTYITQWSVSLELYIILKTAWQVLFPPKSAY